MTQEQPEVQERRHVCERCGYACESDHQAEVFIDFSSHQVAHNLADTLEAPLRAHLAFILNQQDVPF